MSITHVVFDLNGTLADTKRAFLATRSRLVRRLADRLGCSQDRLFEECRRALEGDSLNEEVYQRLPSVAAWARGASDRAEAAGRQREIQLEMAEFKNDIADTYRSAPEAVETLYALRRRGCRLSIWSGSRTPYVVTLVRRLGFDGLVDYVFCPARKAGASPSAEPPGLRQSRLVELPADSVKPSAETLRWIADLVGVVPEKTLLVSNNADSDGRSTVGTGVGFVRVNLRSLDPVEKALELRLLGSGSRSRAPDLDLPKDAPKARAVLQELSEVLAHV